MQARAVFMTQVRQVGVAPVEIGELGPHQVRTHTLYFGISHGTEMAFYRGTAPHLGNRFNDELRLFVPDGKPAFSYPSRYGYSNVGRVVECGAEVQTLKPGDIVFAGLPHQTETIVDEGRFTRLPAGLDPKLGVFLTNTCTTYNGILDANIHLGEVVVISGQGVLGQLLAQMARLSGAGKVVVVDPVAERLKMSLLLGADVALNPREEDVAKKVREITERRGADVVIEVSGTYPGLQEAIRTVAPRGTVVAMGFYQGAGALNLGAEFHHNWVDVKCSQAGSVNPTIAHRWSPRRLTQAATSLMPKLQLAPLITQLYDLEQASEAYALIDQHPESVMQVVLQYHP